MKIVRTAISAIVAITLAAFGQAGAEEKVSLSEGDEAPDFTLPSSDGNDYTLSEVLKDGPVVLAWFPKADTPGCTAQCKSYAQNGDMIKQYNVTYFMISVDTVEDNTKFANKYNADFPILSDASKETAEEYGVIGKWGLPSRHTFYIGTDGKIMKIDRDIKTATTAEDTAAILEELEVEKVKST